MGPHKLWGGGRALVLGPQRLLAKSDNDMFEDFTLVTGWRVDLEGGGHNLEQEASKRPLWWWGNLGGARRWS